MSRIFLVRHGDTESNSADRFWGWTDVRLSDSGIKQAEQLRDRLSTERIDAIYSSNLCRASGTARIIAAGLQSGIVTCDELREINFGRVEGLTFNEISRLYPELTELWFARDLSFQFPGGESVTELNNRVNKFLRRLAKHTLEETILVVAHSGVLRLLICNLLGIELWHWRQIRLDLASLSIVETYPEVALLRLLNDVSHLR